MKYLDGSSFTVHVGGSAYAEGWDRIFKPSVEPRTADSPASCTAKLFDCGIHDPALPCLCPCHASSATRMK